MDRKLSVSIKVLMNSEIVFLNIIKFYLYKSSEI